MFDLNLTPELLKASIVMLLCSLSIAVQAAQPEAPQLDLFAVRLNHSDTSQQSANQLSATIVSASTDTLAFSKNPHLPIFSELKKGAVWVASIRWHLAADDNHTSLAPRFRLESRASQIEIRPMQHSAWVMWHKTFP